MKDPNLALWIKCLGSTAYIHRVIPARLYRWAVRRVARWHDGLRLSRGLDPVSDDIPGSPPTTLTGKLH